MKKSLLQGFSYSLSLLLMIGLGSCSRRSLQTDPDQTEVQSQISSKVPSNMAFSGGQFDPVRQRHDLFARGLMVFVVNNDTLFRRVLEWEAFKQFDQDYNVLMDRMNSIMRKLDPNNNNNMALRMRNYLLATYSAEANFINAVFTNCQSPAFSFAIQASNGKSHPQIYLPAFAHLNINKASLWFGLPNIGSGTNLTVNSPWVQALLGLQILPSQFNGVPAIVPVGMNTNSDLAQGYRLVNGSITSLSINEVYAQQQLVWVVSLNESEVKEQELANLLASGVQAEHCGPRCSPGYTPPPLPVRTEADPWIKVAIPSFRVDQHKESWLGGASEVHIKRKKCRLFESTSNHTVMVEKGDNLYFSDLSDRLGKVSRRSVRIAEYQLSDLVLYANNQSEVEVWRNAPADQFYSYYVLFEYDLPWTYAGGYTEDLPTLINGIQIITDEAAFKQQQNVIIAPNFGAILGFPSNEGPYDFGPIVARKPPFANSAWTYLRTFGTANPGGVEFATSVIAEQDQ